MDDHPSVELSVPAASRHLRLARLTASGFASDLGFSVDEIEDLRLGVDEACAILLERAGDGDRLTLSYSSDSPGVVIEGRCGAQSPAALVVDPVSEAVLSTTLDQHRFFADENGNGFRLVKHAARA